MWIPMECGGGLSGAKAMTGDWQPIETAPKDKIVLVVISNGNMYLARLFKRAPGSAEQWLDEYSRYFVKPPTHWMPLPDPPAAPGKATAGK